MTRLLCFQRRGEEGVALLGALIFVTLCSIVVSVMLGFVDTDFRTTINVREQRHEVYSADAAVEAAIRNYQQSGKTCPSTWTPPAVNDVAAADITVSCSGDGTNAPSLPNVPSYSILTRGSASGDGIRAVSGALTPARGGVFVEGAIDISSGAKLYVVSGSVTATACTGGGTIEVASPGTQDCSYTGLPEPDPVGISSAPAVPAAALALRTVPACPGDGSPIVFQSGMYTDLNGLKALTASCSSNVFHFAPDAGGPGFFHFDFAGGGEWAIGNGEILVGGTLFGTAATVGTRAAGKRCDETQQGVQFILSGESRLHVANGGAMELCPPLFGDTTTQRVTVYGPSVVAGTPVPLTGLLPGDAKSTGNPKFDTPDAAKLSDDIGALASIAANKSATITLSDFPIPALPLPGMTVSHVSVTIRHRETASSLAPVTLSATISDGTTTTPVSSFTKSTSFVSETFDVSGTFVTAAELENLEVKFTGTNPSGGPSDYKQYLDVVSVSVTYTPPGTGVFAPTSGCAATGSTCPVISTQQGAAFTSKGTIYAPLGMLDIRLVHEPRQVFGRGVIVRRLDTVFTSAADCNLATIPDTEEYDSCFAFQLPRNRTFGDNVVFTATVRGRVLLRALVNFTGATPVVRNWSSVNE